MKRPPQTIVVDFETDPIEARPNYPPKPVGVSIRWPGKKSKYYAWGHYTGGNNCTKEDGLRALKEVWASPLRKLFHNAKFDYDVAMEHMDMPELPWDQIDDTTFILFLLEPHSNLSLKPASERILNLPPDEQDAVRDWLWANRKRLIAEFPKVSQYVDAKGKPLVNSKAKIGALIAYAPGNIVTPYANGDCDRTDGIFKWGWPQVVDRGMEEAYDREREIMPILLDNERVGVRVDLRSLRKDVNLYTSAKEAADAWLRKRLKSPSLNLDSDEDVAEALSRCKIVDDEAWTLTATGKRSVGKKNLLPDMYKDKRVASAFGYRNRLSTCLNMFMLPWEKQASARPEPYVSTNWNQVRGVDRGTRTGRPSTSNPNFLNISKSWHDKDDGYVHPDFLGIEELPLVRRYILPDDGGMFCHRDYNGQELRLLGHFEDAALMAAYQEDPRMDVHDHVRQLIEDIAGLSYHRTQVKVTNFRRIYGGGAPATALALNVGMDVAKELLAAHSKALPGVKDLSAQITALSKSGEPITTWGGRQYYVEEPRFDPRYGRHMTYEYKLLNYLIQGSAADCTKEAILRYHRDKRRNGRFLVTVYDEINASSAAEKNARMRRLAAEHELRVLKESMESIECDVLMLTDAKLGVNWADAKKYED